MDIMRDKASLRRRLLDARRAISDEQRRAADAAINAQLLDLLGAIPLSELSVIGAYWPMRGEVDLRSAYSALHQRDIQIALPAAVPNAALRFLAWTPATSLRVDQMGVMVPTNTLLLQPDILLIPCVGFNRACQRLGYGGGHYDRTLAHHPRPRTIGIAHTLAEADFVGETHDIALDGVLTESGFRTPT